MEDLAEILSQYSAHHQIDKVKSSNFVSDANKIREAATSHELLSEQVEIFSKVSGYQSKLNQAATVFHQETSSVLQNVLDQISKRVTDEQFKSRLKKQE